MSVCQRLVSNASGVITYGMSRVMPLCQMAHLWSIWSGVFISAKHFACNLSGLKLYIHQCAKGWFSSIAPCKICLPSTRVIFDRYRHAWSSQFAQSKSGLYVAYLCAIHLGLVHIKSYSELKISCKRSALQRLHYSRKWLSCFVLIGYFFSFAVMNCI